MPILASDALLHKNKRNPVTIMLPLVVIEPRPLITSHNSNTLLPELVRHVLLRISLNFCSCINEFLHLSYLVRINGTLLYKEPKVSVLQANGNLVQKGENWTWESEVMIGLGSIPTGGNILSLNFFHVVKLLMPIMALLPILYSLWKTQLDNGHPNLKLYVMC